MASPGSNEATIEQALPRLPFRVKTAFAVVCAERVMPVVDHLGSELPRSALDLAWRVAEGEAVSDGEIRKLLVRYDSLLDEMYDDGDTGLYQTAAFAPYHALHSALRTPDYDGADYAVGEASSAAAIGGTANPAAAIEEELAWQAKAVSIAMSWRGATARRDMFKEIESTPSWLFTYLGTRAKLLRGAALSGLCARSEAPVTRDRPPV